MIIFIDLNESFDNLNFESIVETETILSWYLN